MVAHREINAALLQILQKTMKDVLVRMYLYHNEDFQSWTQLEFNV